jgi:TRAP-type C4-dicarboxylate transport system permease small subunit
MLSTLSSGLSRLSCWLDLISRWICAPMGLAFFFTLLLQIFIRFVLQGSLAWSMEVLKICFMWSIFMGIAITLKEKKHIMFSFVTDQFSDTAQAYVGFFCQVLSLGFFVYITLMSFTEYLNSTAMFMILEIPERWAHLPLPISAAMMTVYVLDDIFKRLVSFRPVVG